MCSMFEASTTGFRHGMAKAPLPEDYRAVNDEAKQSFQRIGTRFIDPNGVERIVP